MVQDSWQSTFALRDTPMEEYIDIFHELTYLTPRANENWTKASRLVSTVVDPCH
jgi:hypothetical protein